MNNKIKSIGSALILGSTIFIVGCGTDESSIGDTNTTLPIESAKESVVDEKSPIDLNSVVSTDEYAEGEHYTVMDNKFGLDNTVLELFWYGCPHCKKMEDPLIKWKKTMPNDYTFKHIPASPNPVWASHAALFYSLEALGVESKYRADVFEMFSEPREEEYFQTWLADRGLNTEEMNSALGKGNIKEMEKEYKIQEYYIKESGGVPAIIIGGKYLINTKKFKDYYDILGLIDHLIEKDKK